MYRQSMRVLRAQRMGSHGSSARDAATWLAGICMVASGAFWFPIEWKLTTPQSVDEAAIALAMGLFMVVGPPIIISMFVPWSRVGRLLQRLHLTWLGQIIGSAAGLFLLWYAYQLTLSFWLSRQVIADAGMGTIQSVVGLIATIIVPALLWAPGSQEELAEKMRMDQIITNYEEATKAKIRLMRTELLRAQQLTKLGLANLIAGERDELAGYMLGIVKGIDQTMTEVANDAAEQAGIAERYASVLQHDTDLANNLDYVVRAIREAASITSPEQSEPSSATVADSTTTVLQPLANSDADTNRYAASESVTNRYASTVATSLGQYGTVPDQTLLIARQGLGKGAWLVRDLAEVLSVELDTARKYNAVWVEQGVVKSGGARGRYVFTEGGR